MKPREKLRPAIVMPIIVAALLVPFLLGFFLFIGSNAEAEQKFKMNEDGLTYGTILDVSPDGVHPDLIKVVATNGEKGYCYTEELNKARGKVPATLGEGNEHMRDMEDRYSTVLIQLLEERLGIKIDTDRDSAAMAWRAAACYVNIYVVENFLSEDAQAIKTMETFVLWKPPLGLTSDELREDLVRYLGIDASVLPADNYELFSFLFMVIHDIRETFVIEVPVYLEDGKTQIGVFHVPY